MPRGRRDMAPGVFHVWTHSVWTSVLYEDDIDRVSFISELAATGGDWQWGSYRSLIEPAESCTFVDASKVIACFRPEETAVEQLRRYVDHNG